MTTLEVLHAARDHIADENNPWQFSDWDKCTCGHIAAVSGADIRDPNGTLWAEIAAALGRPGVDTRGPVSYISDVTIDHHAATCKPGRVARRPWLRADDMDTKPVGRASGIAVIDRAIAALEADDLLAEIVDNAPIEEREPALA